VCNNNHGNIIIPFYARGIIVCYIVRRVATLTALLCNYYWTCSAATSGASRVTPLRSFAPGGRRTKTLAANRVHYLLASVYSTWTTYGSEIVSRHCVISFGILAAQQNVGTVLNVEKERHSVKNPLKTTIIIPSKMIQVRVHSIRIKNYLSFNKNKNNIIYKKKTNIVIQTLIYFHHGEKL